jgi:AraC-like DNA-binding protein
VPNARIRFFRHESRGMQFELAFAPPHDALRTYVREYVGWLDRSSVPILRRQLPSGIVPFILNFGSTVRERKADASEWRTYGALTAGLHERYTLVESAGGGQGMQVNFTAMGARLFYDRPMVEFANKTIELSDAVGRFADRLRARLYEAASWDQRFNILDREIGARIERARQPPAPIARAWRQLAMTGGNARISELAEGASWSERHFARQFCEHIGLTPKAFARILRFSRAVRLARTGGGGNLAAVAQVCGYYDQAHLAADFRVFAGVTPSALLKSQLPQNAGFHSTP